MLDTLPLSTSLLSPTCRPFQSRRKQLILTFSQNHCPLSVSFACQFVRLDLSLQRVIDLICHYLVENSAINMNVLWEFFALMYILKSILTWPESILIHMVRGVTPLVHNLHWHAVLYNDFLLPIAIMAFTATPNNSHGSYILNHRHSIPKKHVLSLCVINLYSWDYPHSTVSGNIATQAVFQHFPTLTQSELNLNHLLFVCFCFSHLIGCCCRTCLGSAWSSRSWVTM